MDVATIEGKLKAKLDPAQVKSREQGGSKVQYIEGWHAIQTMNDIFGHLVWSRQTTSLREVCRYEKENKYKDLQWHVGYEAKVVVTIHCVNEDIVREGSGYGSGISKDLFSAIESAGKEAETDAMKRALMTLGNPLGLALYDKTRANVGTAEEEPTQVQIKSYDKWEKAVKETANLKALTDTEQYKNALAKLDGSPLKAKLMNLVTEQFLSLTSAQ